jgi:hypothetical protein
LELGLQSEGIYDKRFWMKESYLFEDFDSTTKIFSSPWDWDNNCVKRVFLSIVTSVLEFVNTFDLFLVLISFVLFSRLSKPTKRVLYFIESFADWSNFYSTLKF